MSAKHFDMKFTCPYCNNESMVGADVDPVKDLGVTIDDLGITIPKPANEIPDVRSKISPVGDVTIYRITSDQMKKFILEKARKIRSDIDIETAVNYCEKKRKNDQEPHHSYASLKIAFSHHALKFKNKDGWFGRIGDTLGSVDVIEDLFLAIVKRYQFDRKDIDKWIGSYRNLEELEERFGMTEKYIRELREYATPKGVAVNGSNDCWIVVNARADLIIEDMLANPKTDKPHGRIQIMDSRKITKGVVEFLVHVYPYEGQTTENAAVRRMLESEYQK